MLTLFRDYELSLGMGVDLWSKYSESVPSMVIPDPRAFLYSEEQLIDMRSKITNKANKM